jgi:hypothetical protein
MRQLADRLASGRPAVQAPPDKAALEAAVIATGLEDLAELEAAVESAAEPLSALAATYRGFALAHPRLYLLITNRPLPRTGCPPASDRAAALPGPP